MIQPDLSELYLTWLPTCSGYNIFLPFPLLSLLFSHTLKKERKGEEREGKGRGGKERRGEGRGGKERKGEGRKRERKRRKERVEGKKTNHLFFILIFKVE